MEQIAELERRITAALDRIARGIDRLDAPDTTSLHELSRLTQALEAERMASAQCAERLRAVKERDAGIRAAYEQETARLSQLLDEQALEMQRMRNVVVQLREQVRMQREAAERGVAEPHLINRAMLAELESLRATRMAEVAEMDGILSELTPLLEGAETMAKGGADA